MIRYWSTGTKFVQYNFVFVFANRFIPLSREFVLICIAPVWSLVEVVAQYVSKVLRHNPTMPQKSLKSSLVSKIPLGMADRQATSTVPNTPIAAEFAWSTDTGRQQTVARICWYLTPLRRYPFGY